MKKIFTFLLVGAATTLNAQAQRTVQGSAFFDNWQVSIVAGGTMPTRNLNFPKDVRPIYGLEFSKQLTPVVALGVQGLAGNSLSASSTVIDQTQALIIGKFNLSNLFAGYKGKPRFFELEAMVGVGAAHDFVNSTLGKDETFMVTRTGFNFLLNIDKEKAWSVSLRPAIVYHNIGNASYPRYSFSNAQAELTAALTYHFKNQNNGKHHMSLVRAYDQSEVDGLNAKVNGLREELASSQQTTEKQKLQIRDLQQQLTDCRNRKPVVETVTQTVMKKSETLEQTVTFRQGSRKIDASQLPNVERIATYLKNHPKTKVAIRGYASPEGSTEINAKIAKARAEAVKAILVNKYKIQASRIEAEGQGVGDMFSEPDWNRVSICTIKN